MALESGVAADRYMERQNRGRGSLTLESGKQILRYFLSC